MDVQVGLRKTRFRKPFTQWVRCACTLLRIGIVMS